MALKLSWVMLSPKSRMRARPGMTFVVKCSNTRHPTDVLVPATPPAIAHGSADDDDISTPSVHVVPRMLHVGVSIFPRLLASNDAGMCTDSYVEKYLKHAPLARSPNREIAARAHQSHRLATPTAGATTAPPPRRDERRRQRKSR